MVTLNLTPGQYTDYLIKTGFLVRKCIRNWLRRANGKQKRANQKQAEGVAPPLYISITSISFSQKSKRFSQGGIMLLYHAMFFRMDSIGPGNIGEKFNCSILLKSDIIQMINWEECDDGK